MRPHREKNSAPSIASTGRGKRAPAAGNAVVAIEAVASVGFGDFDFGGANLPGGTHSSLLDST